MSAEGKVWAFSPRQDLLSAPLPFAALMVYAPLVWRTRRAAKTLTFRP